DQGRVVVVNRSGLEQVERLALGDALDDVDQHDVPQLFLHRVLGDAGADVAGADHGDLRAGGHANLLGAYSVAMFLMISLPNSEHFTSLAPSMRRAKSYVTTFDWMVFSRPATTRSAASVHPRYRNIISPERMTEPGLTLSWPAYLGAVPWVASNSAWPVS